VSQESLPGSRQLRVALPMVGRDPDEEYRSSTPLELFFDLVFVVAVAFAAEGLHERLVNGEVAEALVGYALAFFAIWWAWVNFTWFASAYDTDDVVYRVFVFVTMTGALILAAGVPRIFEERNFTIATLGYVVMRIALVTQWLRAARSDVSRRSTARRYAVGVTICQIGWISALAVPAGGWAVAWAILVPAELIVPVWAEAASPTTWHRSHISERYGLFMIIVLGESVLAASLAIRSATSGAELTSELVMIIAGGLLILFSLWWIYFDRPEERLLFSERWVFAWGYLHLFVFAAAAAVGAGLVVAVEAAVGHGELGSAARGAAISVPVAVFVLSLWALYVRAGDPPIRKFGIPVTAALVLTASFTRMTVLVVGILLSALLVVKGRSPRE
jgi:low temperature requirement protein LtrA